jgi:2-polyprenyl-3-methyl-5-hydroxy-6-metoxy-1,4-benzoquinol methylase
MPHRWCDFAELRRQQIESGVDLTFVDVFLPQFAQWVTDLNPRNVIEVGAGTGHLSKSLDDGSYPITAIEPSPGMHTVAKSVLSGSNVSLIRCSSFELAASTKFDLALSHLVAHVVDDLCGFLRSVAIHVEPNGHFLFSIPHPCFYNAYKGFFGDEYNYMSALKKEVSFTVTKDPSNIISGVPYHHRPISTYISTIVEAGFLVSGLHEIYPPQHIQEKYGKDWESPRYCVFRCKKL